MRISERIFAVSLQRTDEWLSELTRIGGFYGPEQAYSALHAVLQTLRDRLTVAEAAQLGAELPLVIRGVYYEGWKPAATPNSQRTRGKFLARVAGRLGNTEVDPGVACRAVFELLVRHVSAGEIRDVQQMMHWSLRDLWPTRATPSAP